MKLFQPMITKWKDLENKILFSNYDNGREIESIEWIGEITTYKDKGKDKFEFKDIFIIVKAGRGIRFDNDNAGFFFNLFPNHINYFEPETEDYQFIMRALFQGEIKNE